MTLVVETSAQIINRLLVHFIVSVFIDCDRFKADILRVNTLPGCMINTHMITNNVP